jgi:hypothetical protein
MSEPERPFLPMSWELGGDFMSGMADSIRERRAREVPEPEREEGVDEENEKMKIRSTIISLTKTLLVTLAAAIAATIGAILSADHWLLVIEFSLAAAGAYGGAGYVLLLILSQLRRLRC